MDGRGYIAGLTEKVWQTVISAISSRERGGGGVRGTISVGTDEGREGWHSSI